VEPGQNPIGGGTLLNDNQTYDTYARYLVKFVVEYAKKGVAVNYITLQNEPGHSARFLDRNFHSRMPFIGSHACSLDAVACV
jgi:O-glycosyl hydrolase